MSLAAAAICLALGAHHVSLPTDRFTLSWTHSVEKTGWQEDYAIRGTGLALPRRGFKAPAREWNPRPTRCFVTDGGITCRICRSCRSYA